MPTKTPVAKTATKKAPAKKVSIPKKGTKMSSVKKPLLFASNEESFWVSDGQILNNLEALRDALATMEKSVFSHHVTGSKNDFAEWVEQVLLDAECAAALKKAKTPATAKTVVVKYLKTYSL